jgi:hypothetical protein
MSRGAAVARAKHSAGTPKFTGILTVPILERNRLLISSLSSGQTVQEAIRQEVDFQRCERICALAEHYGIELNRQNIESALYNLVIRLAEDFGIYGFKVNAEPKRLPGRIAGTGNIDLYQLASEIEKLLRSGMILRAACTALCNRKPWKNMTTLKGDPMNPRALEARYRRHRENLANPSWALNSVDALRKKFEAEINSHEN